MKKGIILIILCVAAILNFSYISFAAVKVIESPIIKTFVSGKQVKFNSAIITVNGEILINANELLPKLGVPNDSKHIVVDKSKKNLTIINGKINIKMKINSNKAIVDKSTKVMNSTPIIYKDKFYIPVKSTSQLLGMKFAWDDREKSTYIQTADNYNKVKTIVNKAITTTKARNKYSVDYLITTSKDKYTSTNNVDKDKNIMVTKSVFESQILGTFGMNFYLFDNLNYTHYILTEEQKEKLPDEEEWQRSAYSNKQSYVWINQGDVSKFVISDILYCGLTIEDSVKENTIKLKGNVYLQQREEFLDKIDYNVEPISTYSEIHINKSKNLITKIYNKYSEYQKKPSTDKTFYSYEQTYEYKEFNGDFSGDYDDETLDDIKTALKETKIYASEKEAEEAKINDLSSGTDKIFIDGAYNNPYEIKTTEGIMFIIIKNENDFKTFNKLSDNSKKLFINKIIQDNYGDYMASETVFGMVTYNSKIYTLMATINKVAFEKLTLNEFKDGSQIIIVVQDKKNNTYSNYEMK